MATSAELLAQIDVVYARMITRTTKPTWDACHSELIRLREAECRAYERENQPPADWCDRRDAQDGGR